MPAPAAAALLRGISPALSAGVLTANLADLGAEVRLLERAGVRLLHFDVMDGCFCPMMTLGPPVIKAVKTSMWKDVHLMIADPLEKLGDYVAAGADIVTVHAESCQHIHRVLQTLGAMKNSNDPERGLIRGIALNPGTPLDAIEPLLDEVDLVLVLAVNPGWSGQPFLPSTPARLRRARQMMAACGKDILTGIDGGITRANVAEAVAAGADVIVTGSAIFDGKSSAENVGLMLKQVRRKSSTIDD
ncbi:MAG: ribulose-phosphate 3-epimerase [Terriglobia bacterium]